MNATDLGDFLLLHQILLLGRDGPVALFGAGDGGFAGGGGLFDGALRH